MKRILAMILLMGLLTALCACTAQKPEESVPTTAPTEPEIVNVPEVTLLMNLEKTDYETHLRVYPANRTISQEYAYVHVTVSGENESEGIRFKLECQRGENDYVQGEFEVLHDRIIDMPGNGDYWIRFKITDSNVYFYRITLYYGEREILLATRTIYTPFQNPRYNEDDFSDVAPEFRPLNGINEEERELFDKCKYAITDYGKSGYYIGVNTLQMWQGSDKLYLRVEYKVTDGYELVYFAINNDNYELYEAHTNPSLVIPNGEGTDDQQIVRDMFYINKALSEVLSN